MKVSGGVCGQNYNYAKVGTKGVFYEDIIPCQCFDSHTVSYFSGPVSSMGITVMNKRSYHVAAGIVGTFLGGYPEIYTPRGGDFFHLKIKAGFNILTESVSLCIPIGIFGNRDHGKPPCVSFFDIHMSSLYASDSKSGALF